MIKKYGILGVLSIGMYACASEEAQPLQTHRHSLEVAFGEQARLFSLRQQTCYKEATLGDRTTSGQIQVDSAKWMKQWNHIHLVDLPKLSLAYDSFVTQKSKLLWRNYETYPKQSLSKWLRLSLAYDSLGDLRYAEGFLEEEKYLYERKAMLKATFLPALAGKHLLRYTWKGYQKVWGRDTLFYTFSWYCPQEDTDLP